MLDKKAETQTLHQWEVDLKQTPKSRLIQILREEEIKWYQGGKTKNLLFGDMNTKYFQLIANGKHRKTRIFQLEDDGKIIKGDEQLKKYIIDYYRGLFGPSDISPLTMDEGRREDIPQVTDDDKGKLIAKFSYNEVLIKDDLMAMFVEFHNGTLPLYSLNFGIITLLPKKDNAVEIQ